MIATKSIVPERKLKIKFTSKRIESDATIRPCIVPPQGGPIHEYSNSNTSSTVSKKRGLTLDTKFEDHKEKKQRIERTMKAQCTSILNKLMNHGAGWIFSQPVDPVALCIPDYFLIVSAPMDLGTIKSKLEKNVYSHVKEFASDVRLTFSNAMLYNPPFNEVHKMAKELNQIFEQRWKSMEGKCSSEDSKFVLEKPSQGPINIILEKTASLGFKSVLKKPIPSKEINGRCSFESSGAHAVEHMKTARISSQKSAKCIDKGSKSCDAARLSSREISTDRSLEDDNCAYGVVSRLDCQAKRISASPMRKSDPDSDVSTVDNESACPSSEAVPLTTDTASRQDGNTHPDVQLSPQRALRAALLKCRFADTILKAQQKSHASGDKNDPLQLKKEKERLERRHREEKARLEAEIRAAEAATRVKAAVELKRQREIQREASRVALDKMERTAEIVLNLEAQEELEILSGYKPSSHLHNRDNGRGVLIASSWPVHTQSMLEQLGLFIKPEYLIDNEEDEEAILGRNGEGKILLDK